ncbi:MAG: hypothetical protein U5L09_08460 [Bacteroidales bacterium]|nr:hypothetical protein [Bacteroidales bacterium]
MLRRSSDNSKVYSESISGGIGNFSVKLYKGFTGGGDRQVELFINDVSQGTSEPFDDYDEHIFEVNNINISGDIAIRIDNITSKQVIVDDITWTGYDDGGNTPPSISNITQTPEEVTSSDAVSVSAEITDSEGTVDAAELHWGTTSGDLTNTIGMSNAGGDTYETDSDIPAQADGTTVYYEVYAQDDEGAESTSNEESYTVTDPASIPYSESFDDSEWPAGWTYEGFTIEDQNYAGGAPYEATLGYFNADAGNSHMTTPAINTTGESELILSWNQSFSFYGNGGTEYTVEVQVSTDGATFSDVWSSTITEDVDASTESLLLNSGDGIGSETYHVRWKLTEDDGSFSFWNVDNISLSSDTPTSFANITITPEEPTSSDAVSVSADVTDDEGVANAELHWGTTSGDLT